MSEEYIFQTLLARLDRMERKLDDHGKAITRIETKLDGASERPEKLEESEVSGYERKQTV